ncbi:MAG: transcription elongation factor GreA [Candidatus Kerfeldbacteria bacterium RIFCSPHIGHO2_02_FULL_42_14]|uniref:Transcription elongation factor GreA n=1 Tax=Candidatus Kerfeldbacteria bacterium RIFCSPHIGHO2_02_FULL_42_14 TaxID=1798540 RepID=A0A1G2ASU2_9BACT|nr:MAG: transcription elongation factor GreA [Candidatus Kerfeldbacteria bacterium RIFCSPHIGHO2_02_FULL_42_14]OGY80709.1 MAG: transcription elongation factor GreA [Candidatus Kerfeldbacteria bacterium RIFCSPHIGHO2_12_FULL_42_13]OGY82635.1 MAG: transcription elongation factor GreA [Candidatus Kerfeldbacteria bacterium RIFCSPLOWO2_02_FULL_42_19]OGY85239.1 MAG: transcription elongation factor GreA [Candidatus Kerfeldbacteria bacterium RIFCSPLOWO2_12_FULL_43_9]
MSEKKFITKEGLKKLQAELEDLKTVKRKEVAQRIKEAKELGDLSENAEYSSAKEEQSFIDGRILELEELLRSVVIIKKKIFGGKITIGSTVKLKTNDGTIVTYTISGSNEADPSKGFISNESPIGQSLLTKKIGDTISVQAPRGTVTFEIIEIQ